MLVLFAGAATLTWIALAGVRGSGSWTHEALAAVVIAWSLTWIGTLIGHSRFGIPRLVGYWVLVLSVGLVLLGTILVWISPRADIPEAEPEAPAS